MAYAVNDEGIKALRGLVTKLTENVEKINASAGNLQNAYEENSSMLGPHTATLAQVIEDVKDTASAAAEPVNSLSEKVTKLADKYQAIKDRNPFGGASGKN